MRLELLRIIRHLVLVVFVGLLVAAAAAYFPGARYLWVALFGALVGISEIVSRYRDAPDVALSTWPSMIYLGINVGASVAALRLIEIFNWLSRANAPETVTVRVLAAGFGAMTLFRSSLFMTRIGDQDVRIGPITFLEAVLGAVDRGIDRVRGESRATAAKALMAGVNFDKAAVVLVPFCLDLMQNLSAEDGNRLTADLTKIKTSDADPTMKSIRLGLKLMNSVGEGVVRAALKAVGPEVRDTVRVELTPASPIALAVKARQQLQASAYDPSGAVIDGTIFVWQSSNPGLAEVDAAGLVTGKTIGTADITATTAGKSAQATVNVS